MEITIQSKEKEQFIENIQKWTTLDSQLKIINEKTKSMREMKHNLSSQICNYITENNLQNKKIQISDGTLQYHDKKEYPPLTYTYIENSLNKIIPNEEHVKHIIQYLKENREVKSSPDIRRTFSK
jgi:hypothetical protein